MGTQDEVRTRVFLSARLLEGFWAELAFAAVVTAGIVLKADHRPQTRDKYRDLLAAVLDYARRQGWIDTNPLAWSGPPHAARRARARVPAGLSARRAPQSAPRLPNGALPINGDFGKSSWPLSERPCLRTAWSPANGCAQRRAAHAVPRSPRHVRRRPPRPRFAQSESITFGRQRLRVTRAEVVGAPAQFTRRRAGPNACVGARRINRHTPERERHGPGR
jgi:hypothetical protein